MIKYRFSHDRYQIRVRKFKIRIRGQKLPIHYKIRHLTTKGRFWSNFLVRYLVIIYFICTNLLELFKIWPRSSNFRQETQTLTMRHSYNRVANLEPGKVDQAGPDLIFWGLAEKFQVNRAGPGRFVQDFRVDWAGLGQ